MDFNTVMSWALDALGLTQTILVLAFAGWLCGFVFFLLTLSRTLERCASESRLMPPGEVWLLLIPLFNLVWQFVVVAKVAGSLRNEFTRRGLPIDEQEPGKHLGFAMCVLAVMSMAPIFGILTGMGAILCWLGYWMQIAGYSSHLAPSGQVLAAGH